MAMHLPDTRDADQEHPGRFSGRAPHSFSKGPRTRVLGLSVTFFERRAP